MGRLIFKMLVLLFCLPLASVAHGAAEKASSLPIRTSVCDLLRDPTAYNHRRIEISGDVSRGFEDFTLSGGKACGKAGLSVWLELGGRVGSEVMYCCGVTAAPLREKPLIVEGVVTHLQQDAEFRRFQKLTRPTVEGGGQAHATLVGVYFSGVKQELPGGTFWGGYGHMGMFSLLVIEQVLSVEPEPRASRPGSQVQPVHSGGIRERGR